jgi:hypothetical protein
MNFKTGFIASCLLLLFAVPVILGLCLHIQQQIHILNARERLEKSTLQSFQLNENEIVWERAGKEILINGQLFDVKQMTIKNGIATITGLFDKQEDQIKHTIVLIENKKSNRSENTIPQVLTNLLTPAMVSASYEDATCLMLINQTDFTINNTDSYSNRFLEVATPPPNC